ALPGGREGVSPGHVLCGQDPVPEREVVPEPASQRDRDGDPEASSVGRQDGRGRSGAGDLSSHPSLLKAVKIVAGPEVDRRSRERRSRTGTCRKPVPRDLPRCPGRLDYEGLTAVVADEQSTV